MCIYTCVCLYIYLCVLVVVLTFQMASELVRMDFLASASREASRGCTAARFTAHGSSITIFLVARMSWRKYHQERAARPVSPEGGYGRVCHPSILDVWVGDLVVCEAIPRASQGFRLLGCLGDVAECRDSQSPLYIYIYHGRVAHAIWNLLLIYSGLLYTYI